MGNSRVWYRSIFYSPRNVAVPKQIPVGVVVLSDHYVAIKTKLELSWYQDPSLKEEEIKYFSDLVMKQLQQLTLMYDKQTPNRGAVLNKLPGEMKPFILPEAKPAPILESVAKEVFDDFVDRIYFEVTNESNEKTEISSTS